MTQTRTPRLPQPRCGQPGCTRFIRRGETFCLQHRDATDRGDTSSAGSGFIAEDTGEPPYDYRQLLDHTLRATLARATSDILDRGLVDELGSLRLVLLRVLLEERDPAKLVSGVARITAAAAQALRVQIQIVGDDETEAMQTTSDLIRDVLTALDAERAGTMA